jgi:hypothetical protein
MNKHGESRSIFATVATGKTQALYVAIVAGRFLSKEDAIEFEMLSYHLAFIGISSCFLKVINV